MKRRTIFSLLSGGAVFAFLPGFETLFAHIKEKVMTLGIGSMLGRPDRINALKDKNWFIWGGSAVKGPDEKYYLLYSRWQKKKTFLGWLTHSEIAVAISSEPDGPFVHQKTALPARGESFWDGYCTHNPHIRKFGDTYYLYYMGNKGDGKITSDFNWSHRNNQRIGLATAKHPLGPWSRNETPLIDVSPDKDAADSLCLSNPSVTKMHDGRFLMIYKAVASKKKLPYGGPVSHRAAIAESPEGPFVKQPGLVFTSPTDDFPAEDPFIWTDENGYRAIAKDMHGSFSGVGTALVEFSSKDGLNWSPIKDVLVSKPKIHWQNDKRPTKVERLERPQIYLENNVPKVLYVSVLDNDGSAYNVPIPLK